MFNWLWEGRTSVYILLAVVAVVLLVVWFRTRDRRWLIATAVVVGLAGVYWLLDQLVVTDAKADEAAIRRSLEEMAAGASRGDSQPLERYLSDQFRSPRGLDKPTILLLAKGNGQGDKVQVKVSNITFPAPPARAEGTARVDFRAEALDQRVRVEAVYDWDKDKGWRLERVRLFTLPMQAEVQPF